MVSFVCSMHLTKETSCNQKTLKRHLVYITKSSTAYFIYQSILIFVLIADIATKNRYFCMYLVVCCWSAAILIFVVNCLMWHTWPTLIHYSFSSFPNVGLDSLYTHLDSQQKKLLQFARFAWDETIFQKKNEDIE